MKAIQFTEYGAPDVLHLADAEVPAYGDNDVLVRVHATAVTSGDVRIRKADPFPVRFIFGLLKPKQPILGFALAGVVEKVGENVKQFKTGDEVFGTTGMRFGAYAEYAVVPAAGVIALKPTNFTFAEAAAVPFGGTTSLYFLQQGKIKRGQKVLVYGASGSLGTSAVQLAKSLGATVTGVCGTANMEMVKSLGADRVIDYTKEDFSKSEERYDIIYDTVGKSPFSGSVKSLKENGYYLRAVHMDLSSIFRGLWTSMTSSKKVVGGVIRETAADLIFLKTLAESGQLSATIDRSYPLEQIVEAHRYVEAGHKKGNVVVTVAQGTGPTELNVLL